MHSAAPATTPVPATSALDETHVVAAVRKAAQATGVPFEFLLAQANQESGLDPEASSTHSSAAGLFQFTASTWLDMVKNHGAEHGLGKYADAITVDSHGHPHVADKHLRHAILELRRDPTTSAIMAAEYAKDNRSSLEQRLGRPASASDLYLAHFLGAAGAAKVLERMDVTPRHNAARLLPDAARANPEIFHEPGSRRPRTVASLYRTVQASFSGALDDIAPVAVRADLAELRPEPRPAESQPAAAPVAVAQAAAPQPPVEQVAALPAPPLDPDSFATAVEPASPFFPVPLPPAGSKA